MWSDWKEKINANMQIMAFNLKKEDLECYKRQQLRKERMNS